MVGDDYDYGFKFKIGDRVTLGECLREAERLNATPEEAGRRPWSAPVLVVRARWLEECPGGVQRHYDCRLISASEPLYSKTIGFHGGSVAVGLFRFHEEELAARA